MMQEEQDRSRLEEEISRTSQASRRLKKRILTVVLIAVAVLSLLYGLTVLLESALTPSQDDEGTTLPSVTYFPPDYEYDIMEDPDYLALDRRIYYTHGSERFILTDENIQEYGPAVQTLRKMIESIIAGDHESYNALFSSNYFAVDGRAPEEEFTMQRVYGIELILEGESRHIDPATGKTYTQYEVVVSYKINRNDGTFRRDLGHDDARKQYFVLSNQAGDEVLIDQILNYRYVNKKPADTTAELFVIIAVAAVVTVGLSAITVIFVISRRRKKTVPAPQEEKNEENFNAAS